MKRCILLFAFVFASALAVLAAAQPDVPLYRLVSRKTGDHLYTTNAAEKDNAVKSSDYALEGIVGYIWSSQQPGTEPLYRLVGGPHNDHFYTTNAAERDRAIGQLHYRSEGTTGYISKTAAPGTEALYRVYNSSDADHLYTTSAQERDNAVRLYHYKDEGTVGYVLKAPAAEAVNGAGSVNVSSPSSGTTTASPVHVVATAQSAACPAGIDAMRIYTAPGMVAMTEKANKIDTQLPLAAPGTYNVVVESYDRCNHAFRTPVQVTVNSEKPSPEGVTVVSPANDAAVTSPVHVVATAAAQTCPKGITAMRIYTAPNVGVDDTHANKLDNTVNLAPGKHDLVVQAWDACNNVYKTQVTVNVTATAARK